MRFFLNMMLIKHTSYSILKIGGENIMLIQFRFKNFKSFRDDTILDMSATKITEFADHVVTIGSEKLLPTAAIFGANASGKSNVIEALRFMSDYVIDSFAYGGEIDERAPRGKRIKRTPFLFDSTSKNEVSSFEVYFILASENHKTYNYGFTLNDDGIVEEWLNIKAKTAREYKTIFYRDASNTLDLTGIGKKQRENIEVSLERETLIVSLGAKLKVPKLKLIRDWFYSLNFANFGNPIENMFLSRLVPADFDDNLAVQRKVVSYLSAFDPSIIGFQVEKIAGDTEDKEGYLKINAIHRKIDSDETVEIPLQEESAGTLKMFSLYPALQHTLNDGGVLLVDELNSRLHPLLLRAFLITFLNPETNPQHAQLIFTTHDSWQLSNHLLRRDEIWFTEKDAEQVSVLYSLADIIDNDGVKIRKDENYEKNYLIGKYGAIPSLLGFNVFEENSHGQSR